ncbi:MAG: hypothetical protein KA319_13195 [Ferruginibacter sp.]|nr:hypothetical protein [Ferruginibacter sp.]
MLFKPTTLIIFIVFITSATSCYYDKYDLLYPNAANCDTATVVSYSQKVVPLLQQQCYSCHNAANPSGGIVMGTHATDKAIALNGKLYGSVAWSTGFSAMPKGGAKMSTCQLALIKKWIDAGSPNN